MFPIAGIGERRSFPNKPNSKGFEKPDLSVVEIDEIGVIYTTWLAVQHFRRRERNKEGYKGKSEFLQGILMRSCYQKSMLTIDPSHLHCVRLWILHPYSNTTVHRSQTVSSDPSKAYIEIGSSDHDTQWRCWVRPFIR